MAVNLDPELLSILVCPKCRSELAVDDAASELVCTNAVCALAYPVRDDIPVLLIDEARDPHAAPSDSGNPAAPAEDAAPANDAGSAGSTEGGERSGSAE